MNPQAPPQQATDSSGFGQYSDWAKQNMDKGVSSSVLQQALSQNHIDPSQQPQHASGNWFTHLLPTIGSVAAPILGTLLAPETGGLSLLAGAALSGAGSAAGKAAENVTENKGIGDNLGTAAVEGGVGGLAGGIGGKLLGKGAEMLGNRATSLTNAADQAGATKLADDAALQTQQATYNNFGRIKAGVQSSNDLRGNQDLLTQWGKDGTSPQVMQQASQGGLDINNIHNSALEQGSPIPVSNVLSSKDILSATPQEQSALVRSGIIKDGDTSLPTSITPLQANTFAQDLGSQARDARTIMNNAKNGTSGTDLADAKATYNQLNTLYKNVQNAAATPEVNATIATRTISPEEKQAFVDKYGQAQADHMENVVNNAQTHQDLVKAKLPFVQMDNLSSKALEDAKAVATPLANADVKAQINPASTGEVAPLPTASDAGKQLVQGGGNMLATAAKVAGAAANNPSILNSLAGIGRVSAKLAPAAGEVLATSPNMQADPINGAMPGSGTMNQMDTSGNPMQQQQNPQQMLIDAMRAQAILAPNLAGQSGATSFLQSIAPMLQKNQLLGSQISSSPDLYANAGGAQGLPGVLSHLTAMIPGTAAHTYQAQQEEIARQLGINPGILPQLMQNGQTSGISSSILGNMQGQLVH